MCVKATYHNGNRISKAAINVEAHPATFRKVWKEISADWMTASAVKYLNEPRRVFGIYVIDAMDGCEDALRCVFQLGFGGTFPLTPDKFNGYRADAPIS
ncbi:MAG: hypothetical protein ACYTBJ_22410 [Planctomycetota bacterium]|jgi:hypothetical protein